jgi:hypothetical protein
VQLGGAVLIFLKPATIMKNVSRKQGMVLCLLLCFPFVGAVGTANPIALNIIFGIITWLAIYILLLCELSLVLNCTAIMRTGILLVTCFMYSQFYFGHVLMPYGNIYYPDGIAVALTKQTVPTAIGAPPTMLLLDEANHNFIEETRSILQHNGFKTGDDIIGLFDMPGLVFAVGGKSPGCPWYFSAPSKAEANSYFLKAVAPKRIRSAFVITKGDGVKATVLLQQAGLNFPEGYILAGSMMTPYTKEKIDIWKTVPGSSNGVDGRTD